MNPSKKKKDDPVELATKLSVCNAGTVAEIKLRWYSETVNNQYLVHDVRNHEVHFWDRKNSLALRLWFVDLVISFMQLKLSRSQLFHFRSKRMVLV